MQAYQFYTTAENGFIRIPDEYREKIGTKIEVTVINNEQFDICQNDIFPPLIDTKSWIFNREEANER